jgi:flagellar hook protein FlgE
MLTALYSGISGLRSHQTFLDVIGNNLANINTPGFKGSRVRFADLMSQQLTSAGAGNPAQIGLGVRAAGINKDFTQGSMMQTGNVFDLAIGGEGLFVLSDGVQDFYTRAGAFSPDSNGILEDSVSGYKVMGYGIANGVKASSTSNIQIPYNAIIPANATVSIDVVGNLNAEAAVSDTHVSSIDIFDGQGAKHTLTMTYTKTAADAWDLVVKDENDNVLPDGGDDAASIAFDATDGSLATIDTVATDTWSVTFGASQVIAFDFGTVGGFNGLAQAAGSNTAAVSNQDGYESGNFKSTSIATDGTLYALYTNGQSKAFAQIERVVFNNPDGLEQQGNNFFDSNRQVTGEPISVVNQTGRGGNVLSGTLENSNVDITKELTNLIIAQRGFQANSRTVSTSSQILQEALQLV